MSPCVPTNPICILDDNLVVVLRSQDAGDSPYTMGRVVIVHPTLSWIFTPLPSVFPSPDSIGSMYVAMHGWFQPVGTHQSEQTGLFGG